MKLNLLGLKVLENGISLVLMTITCLELTIMDALLARAVSLIVGAVL